MGHSVGSTAQCLCPFILSSLPFLESVCLSLYSFFSHVTFTFYSLYCPKYSKYLLSLTPLSLPSHSSPLFTITPPQHLYFCPVSQIFCFFAFSPSLCPSVCLVYPSLSHLQCLAGVSVWHLRRQASVCVSEISQLKSHDTMRHGRSLLLSRN